LKIPRGLGLRQPLAALRLKPCGGKVPESRHGSNALQLPEMPQIREAFGLRAVYRRFRAPKDRPREPTLLEKKK